MKNIGYVINGVLAVAINVLFVLFFTSNKSSSSNAGSVQNMENDSTSGFSIAYVNVDSLLTNYEFAKDASSRLMKKFNSFQNSVAQKQREFQTEVQKFEEKRQNNAFISQERAMQEAQRIQKLEADLAKMAQRLETEYMQEQQTLNNQVTDSVRVSLEIYNKTANYEIILSNRAMDNVLIAKDKYDITNQMLELLNSRYKPEGK